MIEDEIVIGAKQKNQKIQEGLVIDKNYSVQSFQNIILKLKNLTVQEDLMNVIQNCGLESKSIRWSVWRVLLGLVDKEDLNQQQDIRLIIQQKLESNREQYRQLDLQYNQKSEQNVKLNFIDPLSTKDKDNSNPWNNYFEDADLRKQIKIDVERTFQEKDFFRNLQIKKLLNNILFVWAKCNSHISYKQGMNELAGIIAFVCFTENTECFKQIEQEFKDNKEDFELFRLMNDQCYAEADIFWGLDRLLQTGHLEMFRTGQDKQPRSSLFNFYYKNQLDRNLSCAVMRSKRIFENYLHQVDPLLQKHLKNNGVEPQVFLLRWMRCVFQREFHLIDTLELWDAILLEYYLDSDKQPLIFIDCICVSMIAFLKEQLLSKNDSTGVFQRLMKYPPVESVQPILNVAYKLKPIIRELEERELSIFDKNYSQTKKDKLLFNKEDKQQSNDIKVINTKVRNIFQMDEDVSNRVDNKESKEQNDNQNHKSDNELVLNDVDQTLKESKTEQVLTKVDSHQEQVEIMKVSQQLESLLSKIDKNGIETTTIQSELQKCIEQAQIQERRIEQLETNQNYKKNKKPILFIS